MIKAKKDEINEIDTKIKCKGRDIDHLLYKVSW